MAVEGWEQHWLDRWEQHRGQTLTAEQLPAAAGAVVRQWCQWTGDRRRTEELLQNLQPEDRTDPAVLSLAWLALYAATLWREGRPA